MIETSNAARTLIAHTLRANTNYGSEIVRLDNGDPGFETPLAIREAMSEALRLGETHYAPPHGNPHLRELVADGVSARGVRRFSADEVTITHGASGALAAAILAVVGPGDRVVIPEPTFSLYADLVWMAGGEPVYVPQTEPGFRLDLDRIKDAARGAKLIVICNPCNPTGVVYSRAELEGLALIASEVNAWVLADEAYESIVFGGKGFVSCLAIQGMIDRLIYIQTFSKTYAMTGWRLGYMAAPQEVLGVCARIHRTINGPINTATQLSGVAALTRVGDWPARMCNEYAYRRGLVQEMLASVEGLQIVPPEGTFYFFVRHDPSLTSDQMVQRAVEHGVSVRPGNEFGPSGEGFIRLAFSMDRDLLVKGVERLCDALRGHQ
jgi:aspartate/methionine/tyrosine aminotransferase